MKFKAEIDIMPHRELLDPQGKTVAMNLKNIDIHTVSSVRIGKHIQLEIDAESEADAKAIVENACKKLLTNQIMETFQFTLHTVEN